MKSQGSNDKSPAQWGPASDIVKTVLEAMARCDTPWQKPWSSTAMAPVNATTGRAYKGTNRIMLALLSQTAKSGQSDNRWMTYEQAKAQGWQVQKGAKGVGIIRVVQLGGEQPEVEQDDINRHSNADPPQHAGLEADGLPRKWQLRRYTVFNAQQVKGAPELEAEQLSFEPVKRAEAVIEALKEKTGLLVRHGGAEAFYAPSTDEVHLPTKSSFENAFEFHSVILHEAAHSTLAAHRLNRREAIAQRWGDEAYAVEELRAQICSAILAAETGVPMSQAQIVNHAAYLNGWIKSIKRDPMALFTAAKDAEKMADYMLGLEKQAVAVAEHADWVADYDRHR
jgi:antirestriction protein ArdC